MKKITNASELRFSFENLFFLYLKGHLGITQLRAELIKLEKRIKIYKNQNKNQSICMKFGKNDTLVTSIPELISDLKTPTNRAFRIQQMEDAYDLNAAIYETELELFLY